MYTYIVERTQIYLTKEQAAALDREARRAGTTRSHLIREAIDARYGAANDRDRVLRALRATAGLWKDRVETGEEYAERLRTGRRLRELYGEDEDTQTGDQ
jgi:predicted DNA-binding protein